MLDMAFACIGCPFYDPDSGCLSDFERLHCHQYVAPQEDPDYEGSMSADFHFC